MITVIRFIEQMNINKLYVRIYVVLFKLIDIITIIYVSSIPVIMLPRYLHM